MEVEECTSCAANLAAADTYVVFKCPNCLNNIIARCGHCKKTKVPYRCEKCGFVGP